MSISAGISKLLSLLSSKLPMLGASKRAANTGMHFNSVTDTVTSSRPIVRLTSRCAATLRPIIQQAGPGFLVFIDVVVDDSLIGYSYFAELRPSPQKDVVLTTSEGIKLAIARDDVEFLEGTVLDYIPDPGGFEFSNPHPDLSLLPEVRAKREEEERRQRPADLARLAGIDPKRCLAEGRTDTH
jgi:Fe-S cluster assembly iron-binding protein IscA